METYKQQYTVISVEDENLLIKDNLTNKRFLISKGQCSKVKKLNNGELITRYLQSYPKSTTPEVLEGTGLSNSIYVNKLRKKLNLL